MVRAGSKSKLEVPLVKDRPPLEKTIESGTESPVKKKSKGTHIQWEESTEVKMVDAAGNTITQVTPTADKTSSAGKKTMLEAARADDLKVAPIF